MVLLLAMSVCGLQIVSKGTARLQTIDEDEGEREFRNNIKTSLKDYEKLAMMRSAKLANASPEPTPNPLSRKEKKLNNMVRAAETDYNYGSRVSGFDGVQTVSGTPEFKISTGFNIGLSWRPIRTKQKIKKILFYLPKKAVLKTKNLFRKLAKDKGYSSDSNSESKVSEYHNDVEEEEESFESYNEAEEETIESYDKEAGKETDAEQYSFNENVEQSGVGSEVDFDSYDGEGEENETPLSADNDIGDSEYMYGKDGGEVSEKVDVENPQQSPEMTSLEVTSKKPRKARKNRKMQAKSKKKLRLLQQMKKAAMMESQNWDSTDNEDNIEYPSLTASQEGDDTDNELEFILAPLETNEEPEYVLIATSILVNEICPHMPNLFRSDKQEVGKSEEVLIVVFKDPVEKTPDTVQASRRLHNASFFNGKPQFSSSNHNHGVRFTVRGIIFSLMTIAIFM